MINNYLKLMRLKEWLPSFILVIMGYVLTRRFILTDVYFIFITFLSFLLIGSFGFIINDYFDREADKKKRNTRNPISKRLISGKSAIVLSLLCVSFGLGLSYSLLPRTVFVLFLVSVIILAVHSSPPFRLKEKPALDIIISCLIPPVLFLVGYALFRQTNNAIIMLAAGFFILDIIIEVFQEVRDYYTDKDSGFKTTVIMLGIKNSVNLIRIALISFIVMFSLTVYLYLPLYFLLALISLLPLIHFVFSKNVESISPNFSIEAIPNRCTLILIPVLLIIIALWYGI